MWIDLFAMLSAHPFPDFSNEGHLSILATTFTEGVMASLQKST